MQKILNSILLIIFLALVALFSYKTLKNPETSVISVVNEQVKGIKTDSENSNTQEKKEAVSISREEIDTQIHDYIIKHPEVLIESIEGMQKKKVEESDKQASDYLLKNQKVIEEDGAPPVLGNKDGDITIVIFYDYNCSYCRQSNEVINELLKKDPNIKVILRPIPILGGSSLYVSKAALAVHKISEEKFLNFHNEMMKVKPLTEEKVKELIAANNIDYKMVDNEINSFAAKQIIAKNFDLAKNIGIKGVPSYIINGMFIPGVIDAEKFSMIIAELRQAAAQAKDQEILNAQPKTDADSVEKKESDLKHEEKK